VDDFLLFGPSPDVLLTAKKAIMDFLEEFRLRIHEERAHPRPSSSGVGFLGYRVFPGRIRLARENPIRARRRLKGRYGEMVAGKITAREFRSSLMAWMGHLEIAAAEGLKTAIFSSVWDGRMEK
jgi:RNA-directed DNA polymerase